MAVACWRCGTKIKPGSPYCHQCGTPVGARIKVDEQSEPAQHKPWPLLLLAAVFVAALFFLTQLDTGGNDIGAPGSDPAAPQPVTALGNTDFGPTFQTLGRQTETTAIVLTNDHLELIDLDTARREVFPLGAELQTNTVGVGRQLLVAAGALLVPNGPTTWSIDLATGEIDDVGPSDRVAPATIEGHAWLWSERARLWREIDEAGNPIREVAWPAAALPWDHGRGTPELAAAPDGGVYQLQVDGTWLEIARGVPLAGNNNLALLQQCTSLSSCEYVLMDLATGALLTQPLPPSLERPSIQRYRLSPDGNALLEMTPTDRSWEAVFVYRDGVVRGTSCTQGWQHAAWSADGSLLACVTNQGVSVSDVRNGPAAIFNDWDDPPLAIVLVESAAVDLGP